MQDALCTKVNEQLPKARTTTTNRMDKERLLQQTLETCKQIPAGINSPTFVNSYPPANTTEILWNSAVLWRTTWTNSPPHLAVLQQPARWSCRRGSSFGLQELLPVNVSSLAETLHGDRLSSPVRQSPSVPKSPEPIVKSCRRLRWSTTKDSVRSKLNACIGLLPLQSDDELFHFFDWLTDNKWQTNYWKSNCCIWRITSRDKLPSR